MNLPSSISAKAINHNLNKTDKHVHHLNDSKLGNVTAVTATSANATNNTQPRYPDGFTFTVTQGLQGSYSNLLIENLLNIGIWENLQCISQK